MNMPFEDIESEELILDFDKKEVVEKIKQLEKSVQSALGAFSTAVIGDSPVPDDILKDYFRYDILDDLLIEGVARNGFINSEFNNQRPKFMRRFLKETKRSREEIIMLYKDVWKEIGKLL